MREIPQRELRNDVSRVLAAVAAGARFLVTVRGQPVAELGPVTRRRVWVPWGDVVAILERGPLDETLLKDVDEAVDQTIEDPWTRYSIPRSS